MRLVWVFVDETRLGLRVDSDEPELAALPLGIERPLAARGECEAPA